MAEYHNVYCETTKTCTWKRSNIDDKEDALEQGRQHATTDHPGIDEWRVRVLTIRVGPPPPKPKARDDKLLDMALNPRRTSR